MNMILPFAFMPLLADNAAAVPGGLDTGTVLLGLLVLAVLWLASSVSNLRNEIGSLKEMLTAKPRPAVAAPSAPVDTGPTPGELAAIAAAVHFTLGARARVVAVVPPDVNAQAWSREGRREVFQSHQIR